MPGDGHAHLQHAVAVRGADVLVPAPGGRGTEIHVDLRYDPPAGKLGALVAKLFGVRYLATLFGLTLLSHQVGGFFGAWLGGLAFVAFGNYNWMWTIDIALALAAALVNLPIREAPVLRPAAASA